MNENLEDLKRKAEQLDLVENKDWDEIIAVWTRIIDREQEPDAKAFGYLKRGAAYNYRGDHDLAIADFNEALRLAPSGSLMKISGLFYRSGAHDDKGDSDKEIEDFTEELEAGSQTEKMIDLDAQIHFYRGWAYCKLREFDLAIADFTKALEFDLNYVEVYFWRGFAYLGKDNHKAREDCEQALRLNPDYALAYNLLGIIYHQENESDKAIKNFNEALKREPKPWRGEKALFYADVHRWRGLAYINKEDFRQAYEDFKASDENDPSLKNDEAAIYIATQIDTIYGEETGGDRAFKLYYVLLDAIFLIQNLLFYSPEEGRKVAHYTSLHTLKSLVVRVERFRLYNAAHMNDPEEGQVFFKIMKTLGIDANEAFYKDEILPYRSPAYIGSFVKAETEADTGNPNQKDKLFLWRTYGKHDGQEAAGACLIFDKTAFAEYPATQTGTMQQFQQQRHLQTGTHSGSPQKPELFQIVYSNTQCKIVDDNKEFKKELEDKLNPLKESLLSIKEHIDKKPDDKQKKEELKRLVCDLLDSIRFLFKAHHYREEKEVRVVQIRYDEENTTQNDDGIQVDTEQILPRFYLEAHEDLRSREIILGPQTRNVPEWTRWLKKLDITGVKSTIPYTQGS